MPPKQDVSYIKVVKTSEDYKREVEDSTAPTVVDVYDKCWGPCDMLNDKFTSLYFELAESSGLKFVRAECDKITALTEYKDSSQPTFLFFKDGKPDETNPVVTGPLIPLIVSTIKRISGASAPAPAPAAE